MGLYTHQRHDMFDRSLTPAQRAAKRADDAIKRCVESARRHHTDARDGVFVGQLLNAILPQAYIHQYPDLKFGGGDLIAFNTSMNPGAQTWGYQDIGYTGKAAFVGDGATNLPTVSLTGNYTQQRIKQIAISYTVSTEELRASAYQGTYDEIAQKAMNARRAVDQLLETTIISGDTVAGFTGLPNLSGITTAVAPGTWALATPAQINTDLSGLITAIGTASGGVEQPDTVVMGLTNWRLISTTQFSVASNITVLDFLKLANPMVRRWDWSASLDTGYAGGKVVLAYDSTKLSAMMPLQLTALEPQWLGLGYSQVLEAKFGGLYAPAPASIGRLTGT